MTTRVVVRKDTYRDSVLLMRISNSVAAVAGVNEAAVVMATATNRVLLQNLHMLTDDAKRASPNDLVIAIDAKDNGSVETALLEVDRLLTSRESRKETEILPKTLDSALRQMPDANLAIISVPGSFAAREANKALQKGLNVFLFSSNVSTEEELKLKQQALEKNLLMMGPDCGTAIINNVVIGFGNSVNRGTIGIVSAAGTGLQQVSTIVHGEGFGISQAIGTGGGDLSEAVGGLMMLEGIKRLQQDDSTEAIVLISKPPSLKVARRVLEAACRSTKPVVVNFIGSNSDVVEKSGCVSAATLEDAAKAVCALLQGRHPSPVLFSADASEVISIAEAESAQLSESQKFVRGLYTGGTLSYEALVILSPLLGDISSNAPLRQEQQLKDANRSVGHTCVDMGSEEFTIGRPHPMIDYTLRKQRIAHEAADPETAVILLDVVLGYGSHEDPATELIRPIMEARAAARRNGRYLSVVASIIGTSFDHQNLGRQQRRLEEAGVIVMPSNAQAARLAALIASRGAAKSRLFQEVA